MFSLVWLGLGYDASLFVGWNSYVLKWKWNDGVDFLGKRVDQISVSRKGEATGS